MKKIILLCCCLGAAAFLQGQQVIYIPNDYPSIQLGINNADPGTVIIVSEGTYFERISFMGKKDLTVASEYYLDKDESHIAKTILDGSQLPYVNKSVVLFIMGEDTTSTLCGFTIRNGEGTLCHEDGKTIKTGGGIFISGSGARIMNNRIVQNHLNYNMFGDTTDIFRGAGIGMEETDGEDWVIIENNVIEQNTCVSNAIEASGAGISIYGNARIINNSIINNTCSGYKNSTAFGAGISCGTNPQWNYYANVVVQGNQISGNYVRSEYNKASYAGALVQHAVTLIRDNQVVQNEVLSGAYSGGTAGIGIWIPLPGTEVSGNTFSRNTSNMWCGALSIKTPYNELEDFTLLVEKNYFLENTANSGGGFVVYNTPVCLQNNIFSGNIANIQGGAIIARQDYPMECTYMLVLVNNSFYGNSANYGGALYSVKSRPNIVNSIFSGNTGTKGPEIFAPYVRDNVRLTYTNIDVKMILGNYEDLGGNFAGDPLFEDLTLLTLRNTSPCIDNGSAYYTCNHGHHHDVPKTSIDNNSRPYNHMFDVGAYEFINDRSKSLPVEKPVLATQVRVYPNPVTDVATFEYSMESPGQTEISVFDLAGRLIAQPVDQYQAEGYYRTNWDVGILPNGIYFYRMTVGGKESAISGKIVVNK